MNRMYFQIIVSISVILLIVACSSPNRITEEAAEPTEFLMESPTETPQPPDPTAIPTVKATETYVPEPTATEIPIAELVPIYILCNCQQEVPANARIRLHFGWSTKLPEQVLTFREAGHISLTIDGVDQGNLDGYWRDELRGPEEREFPYTVSWAYLIEPLRLEVGTHRVEAVIAIDESVTDGVYTYEPGEVAKGSVEIIVTDF